MRYGAPAVIPNTPWHVAAVKTYCKVEGELGSLVLDLREVARLLVSLEPVCEGSRVCGRDEASQKANQS
jgi:hypothetical protein